VRRLFLIAICSAVLLAACGPSKSFPGAPTAAPTPAATGTAAATPAPTVAATEDATPTEAPTEAAATGIAFAPAGGGFTVYMPAEPKLTTQTYQTAVGDAPASMWTYEVSNDLAYFVVQATYPKGSMTGHSPASVFDAALNGMVTSTTGASVAAKGDTTLNGHAGKTFTIDTPQASLKGVLYIVGDDMYMVYAGYTSAITDMAPVDGFISSFKLTV
jgi:hypothetical protein